MNIVLNKENNSVRTCVFFHRESCENVPTIGVFMFFCLS